MKKRVLFYLFASLIGLTGFAQTSSDSLKISVRTTPGAEIGIDSEISSTNTLSKTVSCGKHKVVVTCGPDFKKEYEIDVTPDGKTSFEYDVRGNFTPKFKQSNTTVYVDGVKYSGKENIPTLGVHNVVAYGYSDLYLPTEITTVVNPLEKDQNTIYKLNKKKPNLSGFLLANYMFRVNAPGFMMGIGRRFGGYMKLNVGINGTYNDYGTPPETLTFNKEIKFNKKQAFLGGGIGITYKPINLINLYVGASYYTYSNGYFEYDNNEFCYSAEGVALDCGIIARYRALLFQIGYTRGIVDLEKSGYNFGEFNIGIGVNIHKNKRK